RARVTQHEAFLVVADGGTDDLGRNAEERLVERSHQHDWPFDQPRNLCYELGVLLQLVALRECEVLGIRENHFLTPLGIEHHPGLFELGRVVLEPAHLEWLRRHEAVAARLVAGPDPVDRERDDLWLLGFRSESRDNGMQWPHPSERTRLLRLLAPTHRLRPGERFHNFRDDL